MKSLNSSGHKRSRLPIVQGKPATTMTQQHSTANKFGYQPNPFTSSNNATSNGDSSTTHNGQPQMFTRRNLFQPQIGQFHGHWATATPASEDGELESQGQESVRRFCTEDTPINSLSKAGSNTNLSSLTFDDEDTSTMGNMKHTTQANEVMQPPHNEQSVDGDSDDDDDAMEQLILDQCRKIAWAEKATKNITPFKNKVCKIHIFCEISPIQCLLTP